MKFPLQSLRARFLTSTMAWLGACLLVTGILVSSLFYSINVAGFHDEMTIHIEELSVLSRVDAKGAPFLVRRMSDPRFEVPDSGFYWQIRRKGHGVARSPSLKDMDIPGDQAMSRKNSWKWQTGPTGETLVYGKLLPVASGGPPLELVMASDERLLDQLQDSLDASLFKYLLVFAALMAFLAYLQFRFVMHPVKLVAEGVDDIRTGKRSKMEGDYPAEIAPLVSNLNSLIENNTQMVKNARLQAGNLAHGLRTPMAIIVDEAQKLADGEVETAQSAVFTRECARMARQIDYHLARARIAGLSAIPGKVTVANQIVDRVIVAMKRLHADRDLTICCSDFPEWQVACDSIDYEEMVANLIDNACKASDSRVLISADVSDQTLTLSVDDDGPGLSDAQREAVLSLGERLDESAQGSGLGLRIVQDLASIYQGSFTLGHSPLGGVKATLTLPRVMS